MYLDLHGFSENQAAARITSILYQFFNSHYDQLQIITGKGSGVLFTFVYDYLSKEDIEFSVWSDSSGFTVYNY
ncbi:Smr domain-containing protein [Mycoplasma testudineum]|uniref:Smr domain-containing protein n=1 Tax=Mycoplasma testudineum TaxID=244584 RepID=A0A4R6ICT2_9MOLU|nr:Smr/MutS family protein [Mycoplasma testudineum]OYD26663.1 DNA mismatch repair protein MutS [Mycoplasma testudineum]TDO19792.1 Smr domain-containing protein [Mycoplasma testudineum]